MLPADPVVLVIGATGYVGAETVLAAAGTEHVQRVIAHVRPASPGRARLEALVAANDERPSAAPSEPARPERTRPGRIRIEECPLEASAIDDLLQRIGPTHVFLCHGTTASRGQRDGIKHPYQEIDLGLTRLMVEAAARLEGDPGLGPRMVYLSSMGTSRRAKSAYLEARWQSEEVLRQSGLPYTICRGPLITGPDRPESRAGEAWARRLADPLLRALGWMGMKRLRGRYVSMDGREAAEGLVRSGFHYMTINRVVLADELRRVGVYESESWVPASRRDEPRF